MKRKKAWQNIQESTVQEFKDRMAKLSQHEEIYPMHAVEIILEQMWEEIKAHRLSNEAEDKDKH